jgi:hypothetical protein
MRRSLGRLAVCVGLLVATVVGWASYNGVKHGVFAYSIIGERNLRFMFGPRVETEATLGRKPPSDIVMRRYFELGHQDLRWLAEPGMTVAEYVRRQREYVGLMIDGRETLVAKRYLNHLESNLTDGWDILVNQLPPRSGEPIEIGGMGTGGTWTPLARTLMGGFFVAESHRPLRWTLVALAVTAPAVGLLRRSRRLTRESLALWIICLYFLLTAATTGGQGSRILYPAFAPAAVLLSGWLTLLPRRLRRNASLNAADKMPAGSAKSPMPSRADNPPSSRPSGVTGAMSP